MKQQLLLTIFTAVFYISAFTQNSGIIYKPAGNELGRSVLDPNNDGFVSVGTNGFSAIDYGSESELQMIPLPIITFEPSGDLNTGSSGGHTDLVSFGNNSNQSCYVLFHNVNGINYLVVRFRIGNASTSTKGYSLLLDVDGEFGTMITSNNPGFEKEIVLETGSSGRVAVYNHSSSGTVLAHSFNVNNYHQRSIALSNVDGNADYFYDFFVPYSALSLTNEPVRIAAATITSASSGISGTVSDFNGINDKLYNNNPISIANAIISAFPATPLPYLSPGYNFANIKSFIPSVNGGIKINSTSISGTSSESAGTVITVYRNGLSIGTAIVNNNQWTLNGVSGLVAGNMITARATAPGKSLSDASVAVEVTGLGSCYTPVPTNLVRQNNQTVTGQFAHADGSAILGNTVSIRLFDQINTGTSITFTEILPQTAGTVFVGTNGTWTFVTNLGQNNFNEASIVAIATFNGCQSGYSVVNKKTSGNVGIVTPAPTVITSPIIASSSIARTIEVRNNVSGVAAFLKLYINSLEVLTSPTTIAAGATYTFSITGLLEGEIITARAQSPAANYWLSDPSASVIVIASVIQTSTPLISGSYLAGSGRTVSGTCNEAAGTVVSLYKQGGVLIGTATVNIYGIWSVPNLTLVAGDALYASAKASGKTISANSAPVTVAASVPTSPQISGAYQAGATSINGTGGVGEVRVYVDGSIIGVASGTNWTLSSIAQGLIYKGAVITATNFQNGIESAHSNAVTVTGVNSFKITAPNGSSFGNQITGIAFPVKVTAKEGLNGAGNDVTTFTGQVVIASSSRVVSGGGLTPAFVLGVLDQHSIKLTTPGVNHNITVVSTDDPTATGSSIVPLISPVSWNGSVSDNWWIPQNWTPNIVPDQYIHANVPSVVPNYPVVYQSGNNTAESNDLNIASGASVKVAANGKLTVNGTLTNNTGIAGLIVEDGGSLITATSGVNATVKRFITGNQRFHLLSMPVENSTFGAPFNTDLHDNIWIRRYDEPSGDWSNYLYSEEFAVATGYSIWMDASTPSALAQFKGILNVNSFPVQLSNSNPGNDDSRKGWNLLGNPYSSALVWNDTWQKSNVSGAVYVWNDLSGNYSSWNGTTGALTDGVIPVAQGFFVKATGPSANITIPSHARVHSLVPYYKNSSNPVISLEVKNSINNYSDATFVEINQNATYNFDTNYDAYKLYGETYAPELYTMVGDERLSINAIPAINTEEEIDIYLKPGVTGNFNLTAKGMQQTGAVVYMTDKLTGAKINLNESPVYSFTASSSNEHKRFVLSFKPTGNNETTLAEATNIRSYGKNIIITASGSKPLNGTVKVSSITGVCLYTASVSNQQSITIATNLAPGIYIVSLQDVNVKVVLR